MAAQAPDARTLLPIACTLGPSEGEAQVRRWRESAAHGAPTVIRTEDRIVVRFRTGAGVLEAVRELAEVERRCCSFVSWTVTGEPTAVVLTLGGSEEGLGAVEHLFAAATSLGREERGVGDGAVLDETVVPRVGGVVGARLPRRGG